MSGLGGPCSLPSEVDKLDASCLLKGITKTFSENVFGNWQDCDWLSLACFRNDGRMMQNADVFWVSFPVFLNKWLNGSYNYQILFETLCKFPSPQCIHFQGLEKYIYSHNWPLNYKFRSNCLYNTFYTTSQSLLWHNGVLKWMYWRSWAEPHLADHGRTF